MEKKQGKGIGASRNWRRKIDGIAEKNNWNSENDKSTQEKAKSRLGRKMEWSLVILDIDD